MYIIIIYLPKLNEKTGIPDTVTKHTAKNITDISLHEIFVAVCFKEKQSYHSIVSTSM